MEPYSADGAKRKREFFGNIPAKILGVEDVLIATKEGLPIVSTLPDGVDEKKVAAMTAILQSLAKKSINEIGLGKFDQLYIKGSDGNLITLQAGPNALLTVFTTKDVRRLMLLDLKKWAEKIAELI